MKEDIYKRHSKDYVIELLQDSINTLKKDKRKNIKSYSLIVDGFENGHTVTIWDGE